MLERFDLLLFHLINQSLANPFFDWLMPLFDKPKDWIPLILIFWLFMAYRDQKYRKLLLILVPLTILCCDQFGGFIKEFNLFIMSSNFFLNIAFFNNPNSLNKGGFFSNISFNLISSGLLSV